MPQHMYSVLDKYACWCSCMTMPCGAHVAANEYSSIAVLMSALTAICTSCSSNQAVMQTQKQSREGKGAKHFLALNSFMELHKTSERLIKGTMFGIIMQAAVSHLQKKDIKKSSELSIILSTRWISAVCGIHPEFVLIEIEVWLTDLPGVGSCCLCHTWEVLKKVSTSLGKVLIVVHEVSWHDNLLLHHVIEAYHGSIWVPGQHMLSFYLPGTYLIVRTVILWLVREAFAQMTAQT